MMVSAGWCRVCTWKLFCVSGTVGSVPAKAGGVPVVEAEVEPVGRGKGDVVGLVAAVAGTAVGCGCPRTPPGLAPPDRVM